MKRHENYLDTPGRTCGYASTYDNGACRCARCLAASTERKRTYRKRLREAK